MPAMVWFRADLRVHDNKALGAACKASSDGVLAVFLLAAGQWAQHDWSGVRVRFMLRTLGALRDRLESLNISLRVVEASRFDQAPEAIARLCQEHQVGTVFVNSEYEVNERARDDAVEARLRRDGIRLHRSHDQIMLPPGSVLTGDGKFYTVFSPFKRSYYRVLEEEGYLSGVGSAAVVDAPKAQAKLSIKSDKIPAVVLVNDDSTRFATNVPDTAWPAGEDEAMARLKAFVKGSIDAYKAQRDFPAIDGTSTLSPHLAIGSISPRQCLAAAVVANDGKLDNKRNGFEGPNHWISELVWREFYKHILVGFPRVSMGRAFRPETERLAWRYDEEGFRHWQKGTTGVPIVDAGMRQLAETGWMHNRVRMVTAMYLTKDLLIDWRWGERHFMRHLVDGDLASNNGGWQWSASTGTDAAPYFRIFNPISQSRRFDAQAEYIKRHLPELRDLDGGEKEAIHEPSELPALLRQSVNYPEPIVNHSAARDRAIAAFKAL